MSGTNDDAADGDATGLAGAGVALVVTVCANNGLLIAAAISGTRIFMPKVF